MFGNRYYQPGQLIDDAPVRGLLGVKDSLASKVDQIEKHHHNRTIWCGKSGDQSGNNWAADTLTPYQAISGSGDYGADPNDEALLVGTDDVMGDAGSVYHDLHEILVVDVSVGTEFKLRFITGSGTIAQAITAKSWSEIMVKFDAIAASQTAGTPFALINIRSIVGVEKIWLQAKNATNNATIDFYIGGHGYPG